MEIKIKITPKVVKGYKIPSVITQITNGLGFVIGGTSKITYKGYMDINDKFVRVFNIEKKNAVKQRDKNGKYITLSPAVVTAYVYDFPIDLLKVSGLSVIQKNRHFVLTKHKK